MQVLTYGVTVATQFFMLMVKSVKTNRGRIQIGHFGQNPNRTYTGTVSAIQVVSSMMTVVRIILIPVITYTMKMKPVRIIGNKSGMLIASI